MTEAERIGDQLRRSLEGDAWHGPALLRSLWHNLYHAGQMTLLKRAQRKG